MYKKGNPFVAALIAAAVFAIPLFTSALTEADIAFPVEELGGCVSEEDCKQYCDIPENLGACIDFAERYELASQDEIERAREFERFDRDEFKGPGGCDSRRSCELYCDDVTNLRECLEFGEDHGLLEEHELDEARKIQAALESGVELPGGCTNKRECQEYCESGNNARECIAFAKQAGFLEDHEIREAEKFVELLEEGKTPGGCKGERECHNYCEIDANFQECIAFAEEAGFISEQEAEFARKSGGEGPGGCKRDECKQYCADPKNHDECFAFAVEHGFVSEEEIKGMEDHREFRDDRFDELDHRSDFFEGELPGVDCDSPEECKKLCIEFGDEHCDKLFSEDFDRFDDKGFEDGPFEDFKDEFRPDEHFEHQDFHFDSVEDKKEFEEKFFNKEFPSDIREFDSFDDFSGDHFEDEFKKEFEEKFFDHEGPAFNGTHFEPNKEDELFRHDGSFEDFDSFSEPDFKSHEFDSSFQEHKFELDHGNIFDGKDSFHELDKQDFKEIDKKIEDLFEEPTDLQSLLEQAAASLYGAIR